ncbi:MAG: hypothetical protein HY517_04330 [Candidatus Aenigmarchaeota archaeon]|nr:hypothetical protein [Candidatus Aenigmarchaeota archaeon]
MPLFSDDAEKRIARLERDMNRRFQRMEESFTIMTVAINRLKKENIELRNDRDFLLERYKDILRKASTEQLQERIIEPAKQVVAENARFLERVAKQGMLSNEKLLDDLKKEHKAPLDKLFELVMNKKKIKVSEAARKFGVHEGLMEQWALALRDYELIEVQYPEKGEPLLLKGKR